MPRLIFCKKLNKEAEGLDFPPYPGPVGKKVYETISKEAWEQWLSRQTMFINEYRLNLSEAKARSFLAAEMEKFLFTDESKAPEGYVPPKS